MIYLFISITCSVIVGVLLKLAKRYKISITQAVTWNYLFAIVLSLFFFKPDVTDFKIAEISPVYIALGFLLPGIFIILGLSVKTAGLARTDIAQRLSLIISLSAAYFLFREKFDSFKEIGLIFGFIAIFLILYRKNEQAANIKSWLYLLLVFGGFGVIDILFKMVSQITTIPYTTSLFYIYSLAFILSLLYTLYLAARKQEKLQLVNFICGCILGFFNFGNILFYLKAHKAMADNPSTVFAAMNFGVIIAGTLVGVVIFKEKLSRINYLGLVSALIAILLITLSKIYAV